MRPCCLGPNVFGSEIVLIEHSALDCGNDKYDEKRKQQGANVFMTSTARISSVPIANAIKRLLKGELSSISL